MRTSAAGEIVSPWNADHVYRHNQNAITAFILFLFIVLNIFNIFFIESNYFHLIMSPVIFFNSPVPNNSI
ncbi:MAG: hypothetical protein KKE35_06735, partial [Actinobacteria bacterium]|nr:hypothetical protein [Actinomycetota bacterium]